MKIYDNIKSYFINSTEAIDDYSNRFYIRSIKVDDKMDHKVDDIYFEPHKRDFFEIAVLVKSTKAVMIGDETLKDIDNCLGIVSPFQTINYDRKSGGDNDKGYIINFKASIFDNLNDSYDVQNEFPFFKLHTLPVYQLNDEDFAEIEAISKEMFKESRGDKLNNFEVIKYLLLVFLYKIKRITYNNEGIVSMNRNDVILAKFEQEILSGNNTFFAVNEYASMMNISAVYLSECVKKATGKSAQKIIIDYKALCAKSLLHQKNKTIAEVADTLGFNEVANFNQFLKRNTGMTATQFRKKEC